MEPFCSYGASMPPSGSVTIAALSAGIHTDFGGNGRRIDGYHNRRGVRASRSAFCCWPANTSRAMIFC